MLANFIENVKQYILYDDDYVLELIQNELEYMDYSAKDMYIAMLDLMFDFSSDYEQKKSIKKLMGMAMFNL